MLDDQVEDQKRILHEMEDDLLALLAIDDLTDDFEVIYTNDAFHHYQPNYRGKGFFNAWERSGLDWVAESDRERMRQELTKEKLLEKTTNGGHYLMTCRLYVDSKLVVCRVKVKKDALNPHTLLLSIRNIDTVFALEQKLQETVKQIQMKNSVRQMQPHFLYNALSSIRELVLIDPEYGADMLYDFTTHLRASIRAIGSDEKIPFSQELENIRAYVNIEKMRFGDKLSVIYDIGAEDFEIIPLSIQPIVENAIKHGIYEKNAKDGQVKIQTRFVPDHWSIVVEDNGIGFDVKKTFELVENGKSDSTGLHNLIFRLENMMNAAVDIQSEYNKGTRVTITIPKHEM